MRSASEEDRTLIHIVLRGGKARAHWNHGKYNVLDRAGLTGKYQHRQLYELCFSHAGYAVKRVGLHRPPLKGKSDLDTLNV